MNWIPLGICFALALVLNLPPWFMAFVYKSKGWQFVGWIYYIFTVPIGIVLLVIGLILSFVLAP